MSKNLFDDDEEDNNNNNKTFFGKVNKDFAEKYDQVKRRQELQRLESKLGKDAFYGSGADDGNGEDDEEEEEEYQGPEDDDAELITDEHETEFANLLLKLRQGDPDLKDPKAKFFSDIDEEKVRAAKLAAKNNNIKKFTLKDEYQRTVQQDPSKLAGDDDADNNKSKSDESRRLKARTADEKKAKLAFLEADAAVDDKAVTSFSIKKGNTTNNGDDEDETEEERLSRKLQKRKKKALEKAFAIEEEDDPEEAFLKTFFREEKWKEAGENNADDDDDDNDNDKKKSAKDWEERMKEEQDEQFYDDAEIWEQEYQQALYRHQEGEEALKVQTFPRHLEEGLLRQKDSARAEARQRKAEREKETETKLDSEVKRLKHLKRQEIEAQRKRIATVAGIPESKMKQLAKLLDDELTGGADFDPSSFDKIMSNLFNDDYYDEIDDDELHRMEQEQEDAYDEEDDEDLSDEDEDEDEDEEGKNNNQDGAEKEDNDNDDNDDDEELLYPTRFAEQHMEQLAEKAREEKKKGGKKSNKKDKTIFDSDGDDDDDKKTFSSASDVKNRLKKQLDRKVDEYWKLHYEDVLADGTKTRFKYREVPAETFGLSDEAVLMTDDRTLNMIAPMNCYASYLTVEQNKKDRFRSMHRAENMRFLDPTRKTRRYKSNTVTIDPDEIDEEQAKVIAEKARKIAEEAVRANQILDNNNTTTNKKQQQHQQQERRPPQQNQNQGKYPQQKQQQSPQQQQQQGQRPQQQTQTQNNKPKFNNNSNFANRSHQQSGQQQQQQQPQKQQSQNFSNKPHQKTFSNNNAHNQQKPDRESGKRRQRDE